ncbi:hypothetical protein DU52_15710 [Methanosarcina mazei]|uniref:Uncharacterized protein n=1 Tax=Methanosarcina mazei TaxID=2209 RepID=A0A0F8EZ40_METMZ|nr:hypothetical protein [Methanosarcina mazei]KKG35374.1 hypothetical protein DU52_15710 [Methanosarcina mazei]
MSIKSAWARRKQQKQTEKIIRDQSYSLLQQEIAFLSCVNDLKPVTDGQDNGYYTWINKNTLAQGILVGRQDKLNPIEKGFDRRYKIDTVTKIMTVAKQERVPVLIGHKFITIKREVEGAMLKTTQQKISTVKAQVMNGDATATNITYNKVAEKEVTDHTVVVYNGDDHYSWYAMPVIVTGRDKATVDRAVSRIRSALSRGGVRCEIPQFAQKAIIQAVMPTNQVKAEFLQPVNNWTIMSMLPIRNPDADFPKQGPIICTNAETLMPIKLLPTKQNPENTIIVGPPGAGKTTMFLTVISHALALDYHVKLIEPKNEDYDGTDYINFCNEYGGGVSRWGPDGVNPDPLIIFYDKTHMGTNPASYRKAKDDWFEVVLSMFSAWIGGLNERQSGLLTMSLIDLYKRAGVIDEDGNPINTEKWDVPGAIAWPSVHELRLFWRKEYAHEGTDYYKDPSIDALIMNTMNAEPGGTLWWWANSHEHMHLGEKLQLFDISQLPDRLRSAISIQIMGACNTLYFPKPADGTERVKTLLIFDEVKNLSRTPELIPYMERSLTEGRAPGITAMFGMQHPLKDKSFMETIKANCKNLFILDNLDEMNIDIYLETFKIDEKYRTGLMRKGSGHGHYFRNRLGTKFIVEVDEMPGKAVFESERGQFPRDQKATTDVAFEVEDAVREIYEDNGFFVDSWIKGFDGKHRNYPGFTDYRVQDPLSTGRIYASILTDKIKFAEGETVEGDKKQDKIGVEGYKHYSTACILAGWINNHKLPMANINHNNKWDIESGNLLCIEIESSTNHTVDKLNEKLKAARGAGFKHIIFTGTGAECREMKNAEGSLIGEYVYPYGSSLLKKLEEIADEYREETPNQHNENLVGFSVVPDGLEA